MTEEQQQRARWRMMHDTELTQAGYFLLMRNRSTTSNGVCGLKLHYHQFADLTRKTASLTGLDGLPAADIVPRLFPDAKHIWLTRRDKARQAVSLAIAEGTDEWWQLDSSLRSQADGPDNDLRFDALLLERCERELTQDDEGWAEYFRLQGVDPLIVYYEDLASDYFGSMQRILAWLQIDMVLPIAAPRLRRQTDDRKEEWETRYLAHRSGDADAQASGSEMAARRLAPRAGFTSSKHVPALWKQGAG